MALIWPETEVPFLPTRKLEGSCVNSSRQIPFGSLPMLPENYFHIFYMHRPSADTEQHNNPLSTPRHWTERAQAGTEQGVHTTIMTADLG